MIGIWDDPILRSAYVEIGRLAIQKFAGKTGDSFICSSSELCRITCTRQPAAAVKRMTVMLAVSERDAQASYDAGTSTNPHACLIFEINGVAATARRSSKVLGETSKTSPKVLQNLYRVGLRNFAKKQGLTPVAGEPPNTELRTPNPENPQTSSPSPAARAPAEIPEGCFWIAEHLKRRILAALPDARVPASTEASLRPWAGVIDRMLRIDGREASKVVAAIDWALGANLKREASFVVLSARALRTKYDRMSIAARLDVEEQNGKRRGRSGSTVAQAAANVLSVLDEED